jgi:hypothetical protein
MSSGSCVDCLKNTKHSFVMDPTINVKTRPLTSRYISVQQYYLKDVCGLRMISRMLVRMYLTIVDQKDQIATESRPKYQQISCNHNRGEIIIIIDNIIDAGENEEWRG